MNVNEMTGRQLLQAIIDGHLPPPSIFATIGMTRLELGDGRVRIHAMADERVLNPMGGVHGGFAATVIDSVTGCAVHSMLDAGVGYGTVDLSVKMMRPVPKDVPLVAEGIVTHVSRSLGIAEATLRDEDGKLFASGSATCFIRAKAQR